MLALYRSGRQAEALEQYRRARAELVEKLGLEPTEELRELERAILAHDPGLAAPAPVEAATEEPRLGAPRRPPRDLLRPRALAAVGVVLLAAAVVATAVRVRGGGPVTVAGNSVAILDVDSGRIIGDVPVGRRPVAVAVGAGSVWVANAGSGTVSRIDPRTHKVVATIGVRVPASDVAVGEGSVWVVGGSEGTLVRIDPRTDTPVRITNLAGSNAIAPNGAYSVAAGAGSIWVGSASWNVLRIDPATGRKVASIPVGQLPVALAVAGGDVWATLYDGRTVRIDARADRVTGTAVGPSSPLSLAAGAGAVWVGDEPGLVWRIELATALVAPPTFSVPPRPLGLAVSGRDVWSVSPEARAATRIDTRSGRVLTTVSVHGAPLDVAAGAGALWVTIGRPPAREHP
jgi:YVTN family beta-propeller protein